MPARKIVSPSDLNAWLTAQIRKVDGCKDCQLTWKYRLREPEKHGGCNWSELNLRYGEGTDHTTAINAALTIEREAFCAGSSRCAASRLPSAAYAGYLR